MCFFTSEHFSLWVTSCGAEGDADPLSYPTGREQLLGEDTVESVEPGLSVSVVGECSRLVVEQHADAAVLGAAGQSLTPAVVPCAELMLVQLQAPWKFVHTHHAPLALLLPGDGLVGYLMTWDKWCEWNASRDISVWTNQQTEASTEPTWVLYPKVRPGLGHLQLPVVLSMGEALKAEHLPGVIEASFMGGNRARPRGQMLSSPVLQGQKQVPIGCAGVKGQRTSVCNDKERSWTDWFTAGITGPCVSFVYPSFEL